MLFLGAGASVPLGKPVTKDFKEILYIDYPSAKENGLMYHLIHYRDFQDIEHVLDCATKLNEFGNKTVSGEFLKWLGDQGFLIFYQSQEYRDAHNDKGFEELAHQAEGVIKNIKAKILYVYRWDYKADSKVQALYEPLIDYLFSINGHDPPIIATTNYDLAIEKFCQKSQYEFYDGFKYEYGTPRWTGSFYYPEPNNSKSVILYKLHGSLNWKKNKLGDTERLSEESDPTYSETILIYPTLSPKEAEKDEPHNTIIQEFDKKMFECDVCIVIGYSFRDDSIKEKLKELLKADKKLIVVDKLAWENLGNNFLKPSIETAKGDRVISVGVDGNNNFKKIHIIPEYINNNMDDIVRRISRYID